MRIGAEIGHQSMVMRAFALLTSNIYESKIPPNDSIEVCRNGKRKAE
jgi:hypothetical protein